MNAFEALDSLDLDNHRALYQEVESISAIHSLTFVNDG